MKTKEELNALKEELETENNQRRELTDEELEQVTGGKCAPYVRVVVKFGDTVSAFATTYHTDVSEILRLNHLANIQSLQVGQELLIPDNRPQN